MALPLRGGLGAGNTGEGFAQSRQVFVGASPITLLLTRPEAQGATFAKAFAARFGTGIQVVQSPIMAITPRDVPLALDGITGLVFTSANGVESFATLCNDRRFFAYCVGARTADAARKLGLEVQGVAADADALVAALSAQKPGGRLLHLCGAHRRGNVAARLSKAGQPCAAQVIYDQIPQELSQSACATLAGEGVVLLPVFSPRSAALLSDAAQGAGARLALATMSAAVTQAWIGPEPLLLRQARTPDSAAMLDALGWLIDTVERLEGGQLPS